MITVTLASRGRAGGANRTHGPEHFLGAARASAALAMREEGGGDGRGGEDYLSATRELAPETCQTKCGSGDRYAHCPGIGTSR